MYAALLAMLTLASTAVQGDHPLVVTGVVRGDLPADEGARVLAEVADALVAQGAADVARVRAEDDDDDALAALTRAIDDADALFQEASFEQALARTRDAEALFAERLAYGTDPLAWDAFSRALLVRALAEQRLDRRDDARRTLAALAALRPTFRPGARDAPPELRSAYAALADAVARAPMARIRVATTPVGAEVVIDGVLRGRGPQEVLVPPGAHYVGVRAAGELIGKSVSIAGDPVDVAFKVGDPRALAARVVAAALQGGVLEERLVELLDAVGPDCLVAVVTPLDADRMRVVVGRVVDRRLGPVVGVVVPRRSNARAASLDALAARALGSVDDAWIGAPGDDARAVLLATPPADDTPVFIGLAAAAAGVAAIGGVIVAAVLVVRASTPPTSFTWELDAP